MLRYSDVDIEFKRGTSELDTPGIAKVYQYLRDRGITEQDVQELGLHIVPARELIARARGGAMVDDPRLAIVFPHADASGKTIDWWSARLVDAGLRPRSVTPSFTELTDKKWGKMFCPPVEAPHAYLVPTLDWMQMQRGDKVYIHESCIKAIAGAKLGYWSVGLNGVRGWSSRKHGIAMVEELRGLPWKALDLQPIIVFDSNAATNWDVQHAISSLASKIKEFTGKEARHLLLPKSDDGRDWGFDDFVVARGEAESHAFLDAEGVEIEISEKEVLKMELNEKVCVVRSLGKIVEQESGTIMSRQTFIDVNYATYVAVEETKDGKASQVNVPRLWLADSRRMEVNAIEYSPGRDLLVPGDFLNAWRGMGLEPGVGDVSHWLSLLERNIPDAELRKWVIQWFAYPLQNLGAKLNTYIHMYGPPGTGKNALLAPLLAIYGDNGISLGKERIVSDFNSVYAKKQFINLDELHGGSERDALGITNKIKRLTTDPRLTVNTKGQAEYEVDNHINLVTTSNYADSIKLDENDRRACVIMFGTKDTTIKDRGYWEGYFEWVNGAGSAALFDYLLGVDLEGFNPKGWAPETEWKEIVTDSTRGAMEKWVRDLWEDPDLVLPRMMQGTQIMSPEQLGAAYVGDDTNKNTPGLRNSIGVRMQDIGFRRTPQVKIDGKPMRFWVVGGRDKEWTNDEIRSAYKKPKGKF